VRLESNLAPRFLTASENWITESSNLTEERLDIVFKRFDVPKRMTLDLVGLSAMPFSHFHNTVNTTPYFTISETSIYVLSIKLRPKKQQEAQLLPTNPHPCDTVLMHVLYSCLTVVLNFCRSLEFDLA